MENVNTVVLEPSTNTHTMKSKNPINVTKVTENILVLDIAGEGVGIVQHGEHGTLRTESNRVVKYNQLEFNPVTNAMQLAYD